jgi:hypothetical protein
MQQLELKSIYMLCESCSSSHTDHSKIGFAIFELFCDFIWILQVAAKTLKGVKKHFCEQAPGKIELFAVMPVVCAQAPGQKTDQAIGSSDMGGGGGGIPTR